MLPPGEWYARCIFPPNDYNLFLCVNNDTFWYLHDYKGFKVIISKKSKFMHTWLTRFSWSEPGNNYGRLMHRGIDLFGLNMAAKRDKVETRETIFLNINFLRLILLNLLFNTLLQQIPFNWKPIQRKPL